VETRFAASLSLPSSSGKQSSVQALRKPYAARNREAAAVPQT
jgi:hypothetical protein